MPLPTTSSKKWRRRGILSFSFMVLCGLASYGAIQFLPSPTTSAAPIEIVKKPAIALYAPVVLPVTTPVSIRDFCASEALIKREIKECIAGPLTQEEQYKRLVHDYSLKDFSLFKDSARFSSTSFKVGSFNILGASHTSGKEKRKGFAGYESRLQKATKRIKDTQLSVVGLQEFQTPQYHSFKKKMPQWGVYPGIEVPNPGVQNSIAWNSSTWERVEAHVIAIPYFGGKAFPMPYVLLRNKITKQEVWFANFHNPTDKKKNNNKKWRTAALTKEANLAKQLTSKNTPAIFTGDMNDRKEFYCPFGAIAPFMHGANGANYKNGCDAGPKPRIDWVLGSSSVSFSEYVVDFWPRDTKASDHPLIRAQATIGPQIAKGVCKVERIAKDKYVFCPNSVVKKYS